MSYFRAAAINTLLIYGHKKVLAIFKNDRNQYQVFIVVGPSGVEVGVLWVG